jgi:lipopolysaccharide transport protein LptA
MCRHLLPGLIALLLSVALAWGAEAPAGKPAPGGKAAPLASEPAAEKKPEAPPKQEPAAKKAEDAKKAAAEERTLEHLDSWAETMVYENETGKFHLTGNVTVIKGTMRVSCNEMTGEVEPQQRQINRVIAVGNVQIVTLQVAGEGEADAAQDPWHGTCSRADYDLKRERVEMQGAPGQPRPRLLRAKGLAEADTIIFYPEKGEYELMGDPVIRGDVPVGPSTR